MNPELRRLHCYPFEKLAALKQGAVAPVGLDNIALSIGEPQHPALVPPLQQCCEAAERMAQFNRGA
jgi:N-succinyldiaminopimelate aminotransferase